MFNPMEKAVKEFDSGRRDGGFYYLHQNGDLIWKRFRPEEDAGGFVKKVWPIDTSDRGCAWIIAVEALALGANKARVFELKEKWGLTDEDAHEFVGRIGLKLFLDGNAWCVTDQDFVDLVQSQAGFGETALEALADFARQGLCKYRADGPPPPPHGQLPGRSA